jgi:RNA polymerase sigma factor (sigma-70 family)
MSDEVRPAPRMPRTGETPPQGDELTDRILLDRFTARGDEAAFAELVRRYGALVLGVCRRVLRHEQDAEDAFQATFLVLVRQAGVLRRRESVGSWLHEVACRIALKVKRDAARRRRREKKSMREMPVATVVPELIWEETRVLLDEELERLPRKYSVAVVLCYLEGKSTEEAARILGCARGTVLSRLARARQRLRRRLARRGLALSVAVLSAKLSQLPASAASPPPEVVAATLQAARGFAAGTRTGDTPARPEALADGCLRSMRRTRRLVAAAGLLSLLLLVLAVALLIWKMRTNPRQPDTMSPLDEAARERERFTGHWSATEVVFNGAKTPDAVLPDLDLEFDGNRVTMFQAQGTFELDRSKNPKEITFLLKGEFLFLGIYEFRGEDLVICHRASSLGKRPTTFQSEPKDNITLMTLRKN